jgi:hypothetical protein
MVEILNSKKGATVIKLNVQGILMFHRRRDKNMEYTHFNWVKVFSFKFQIVYSQTLFISMFLLSQIRHV